MYWTPLQTSCRTSRGFCASLTHEQVRDRFVGMDCKAKYYLGVPSLFLPSKSRDTDDSLDTILEVHVITPPNSRSWFLGEQVIEGAHRGQLLRFDVEAMTKMESCC